MMEVGAERTLSNGIKVVYVPSGCFMMGSVDTDSDAKDNEKPQHKVCLTKSFWIGQYQVTNAEYQQFITAGGYSKREYWSDAGWTWKNGHNAPKEYPERSSEPNQPRIGITWYEAEAFATWSGGRLPTEAEWEYAARGPNSLIYPWGNEYKIGYANIDDSSIGGTYMRKTTVVGSYPNGISWINAYDIIGNVSDWCADWFARDYSVQNEQNDPIGPANGTFRVVRGGTWNSLPKIGRAASRLLLGPASANLDLVGMRIVVDSVP